jgi:hypothetical protein
MDDTLIDLHDLSIHAAQAEVVTWQGRETLRLENGLAMAPEGRVRDGNLEVLIGTEGLAYPGLAFRIADVLNFELAYAAPHVSGQWDALQYDPVFHGSNTWQLYHGPAYQRQAEVPTGRWFRLTVDFSGARAALAVDGQPPFVVEQLARPIATGRFGVWSFRPAYFCDLRVSAAEGFETAGPKARIVLQGVVETWFVEGYGVVACEPSGILNLNRYLPPSLGKACLIRRFETARAGEVTLEFGFSDALSLELDGEVVYRGENTFQGFSSRAARGYVELGMKSRQQTVPAGSHCVAAELEVNEGFGWGLVLAARGEGLHWLPAELG